MQHAHSVVCLADHNPQRLMKPLTTVAVKVSIVHLLMFGIALAWIGLQINTVVCKCDFEDHAKAAS